MAADLEIARAEIERLKAMNEKDREAMNEWAESDARGRREIERIEDRIDEITTKHAQERERLMAELQVIKLDLELAKGERDELKEAVRCAARP